MLFRLVRAVFFVIAIYFRSPTICDEDTVNNRALRVAKIVTI
jgi:hypothetical protein